MLHCLVNVGKYAIHKNEFFSCFRYLVKNEDGKVDTAWWNSDGPTAAYVDFTNESAKKWWSDRLKHLQTTYAIDSFKFDAGETSWSPQVSPCFSLNTFRIINGY